MKSQIIYIHNYCGNRIIVHDANKKTIAKIRCLDIKKLNTKMGSTIFFKTDNGYIGKIYTGNKPTLEYRIGLAGIFYDCTGNMVNSQLPAIPNVESLFLRNDIIIGKNPIVKEVKVIRQYFLEQKQQKYKYLSIFLLFLLIVVAVIVVFLVARDSTIKGGNAGCTNDTAIVDIDGMPDNYQAQYF